MKDTNITNKTRIVPALRQLFLRSRERATALKREQYTCQICKVKKSQKKGHEVSVRVHHKDGIQWDALVLEVRKYLLCSPDKMQVLCKDCHKKTHEEKL